jgi:hypothetical protein
MEEGQLHCYRQNPLRVTWGRFGIHFFFRYFTKHSIPMKKKISNQFIIRPRAPSRVQCERLTGTGYYIPAGLAAPAENAKHREGRKKKRHTEISLLPLPRFAVQ